MSILSVCQDVCKVVGLDVPTSVVQSTDREHIELTRLANEMARRITRAHDWQILATLKTYTGDGTTTGFTLPADYDHMPKKSHVWSSALQAPFDPITSFDDWLGMEIQAVGFVINAWIIYGGQMHIKPAMATGETAQFFYIGNATVAPTSGSNKAAFTSDDDTFRLDEQLLQLGMIWQWRANKGQPYAEDMENFEVLQEQLISRDRGSHIIKVGQPRHGLDLRTAYPRALGS